MLYFGYGSNMPRARIERRLGPCERLGAACLSGWRLAFHKRGADGSGKCDAVRTGHPDDRMWGALDRLTDEQMEELDRHEAGYDRRTVAVTFEEGTARAMLYVARRDRIDPKLRPYHWYRELVLAGARELELPREYVASIEEVTSRPDPCPGRSERNRTILDDGSRTGAGRTTMVPGSSSFPADTSRPSRK